MTLWFRNIMALSLLFAYSLSMSVSIQNFIIDTVLNSNKHHELAVKLNDSKTPELYSFPDLEPPGESLTDSYFNVQIADIKVPFQNVKHTETYTLTKNKQYLLRSISIQPGLDLDALLYPFHSFS